MFKGLRTKIESERKGQAGPNTRNQNKGMASDDRKNFTPNQEPPSSTDKGETTSDFYQSQPDTPNQPDEPIETPDNSQTIQTRGVENSDVCQEPKTVIKERDEIDNQEEISDNIEVLRHQITELQSQIAKKNRQLKIRQQNLIDMKRTLQKEILDHGRTRDELTKLHKQLKDFESSEDREKASNKHVVGESVDETTSPQFDNISEDTISLNAANGVTAMQFDRVSHLSRSSASVDEFESNDLQLSNNNKELSREYLRNVLFRYMTSTDSETTQHLVKAISVLMDFTPEQSAAIKNSMHSRMSSWLRLK